MLINLQKIKQCYLNVSSAERIQKTLIKEFQKLAMVKQGHYQNVLYVVVKNQNLLKNKKQAEY